MLPNSISFFIMYSIQSMGGSISYDDGKVVHVQAPKYDLRMIDNDKGFSLYKKFLSLP